MAVLPLIPCRDVSARQPPAHACKHREAGLRPVSPLGRYFLTMRTVLQLFSPYPPSPALHRMELPAGRSSHDFLPFGYVVGGASHPVNSATAACPPRDLWEHTRCCPVWLKPPLQHIQSRDLVSRLTSSSAARPRHRSIDYSNRPVAGSAATCVSRPECLHVRLTAYAREQLLRIVFAFPKLQNGGDHSYCQTSRCCRDRPEGLHLSILPVLTSRRFIGRRRRPPVLV